MLIWFRSDLRIHDNPALDYFIAQQQSSDTGKAIFFISHKQWAKHDWAPIKIDFLLRHAQILQRKLVKLNIELSLVEVEDFDAQVAYLRNYCHTKAIKEVVANSELGFNENKRDRQCVDEGISLKLFEADVITPKGSILNKSGDMFKVFTPFKRAWLTYIKANGVKYTPKYANDTVQQEYDEASGLSSNWPLITDIESEVLPCFLNNKLLDYSRYRDFPALSATSKLSPYLTIGALSSRYLLIQLLRKYPDILVATDTPQFSWLNELIWRDFYRHLLFHRPDLSCHRHYNPRYDNTVWPNHLPYFEAWKQARTGYPIVDAAMRQLVQTGWMHNRLRMVVASFLTKHLLIDWRWGEQFFMQQLIDGDLAANNGGWQWAASTGCDAQPYFRIFNPITQSQKFDANGDFIRTYLPELNEVPTKHIHFPHQYLADNNLTCYWPPVVEHKQARARALAFYGK